MKKIELKLDRETLAKKAVMAGFSIIGSTLLGALYKADQVAKARLEAHFDERKNSDQDQTEPITD